ncbi:N-acetyl-gamma-glutamyl-phosphate reductase [Enterococcus saccharolyticus]|uniref:N-acetyl-gamma-glutamyl-phosphate reductase n=1 Tax=Enterococcus saccharolyticus TaxID=41997 RepID=UPI001E5CC54F|nr:N-acetyl-gamma-glutamyl-phosphate reductase [Enterococcus saccharolyticus]MCD5001075.1 N-acetyl-gamma-glutamyl-phosphate reductase [Enterococcus saccharolyticus]
MKAAIVGVTGYTGIELVRLIHQHPVLTLGTLHSHSLHKNSISEIYPHLQQLYKQEVEAYDAEKIMACNDLVFFATPSGISKDLVADFVQNDFPVIDLSGDLRLKNLDSYRKWYQKEPTTQEMIEQAVYAFPEFTIEKSNLLANPGCYATAAILALVPLVQAELIELDTIILDGKSGLSGAGKQLSDTSHYVTVDENMSMYKLNQHQHIPEIIQFLQQFDQKLTTLQFTTSLIPVKRGIFMTLYAKVKSGITFGQILQAYQQAYENKPFVRLQDDSLPELRQVIGTNFCDIGFGFNEDNRVLTVVSVIDNLVKGAAGQAIQNFNKWAELDETSGLMHVPLFP